ncbi:hypothetical protein [Shimia thalassica]|uniref:hypothetical protein n=1 Tax=Shimia thalassica TaxID=1715693 RepID=UPI0026E1D48E|nr:hypothetical protein [Shimia thalassica]MDO6483048.1 hypothetical protein [Shimia thalassica]
MYVPQKPIERLFPKAGKRMLFIHTPKCGGKFIGASFGRRFRKCFSLHHPDLRGHLTWQQYRDAFQKNGWDLDDYALFSVIRNPWQWHLSWFNYIRKDTDGKKSGLPDEHALFVNFSFLDYLRWLEDPLITGKPNQYYLNQVSDWFIDKNETVKVPDILRQEALVEDLERLRAKHNLLLSIPKNRRNQSFWGDYRSEYCAEGVDIVARRHQRDIAMFGYEFENPKASRAGELIQN